MWVCKELDDRKELENMLGTHTAEHKQWPIIEESEEILWNIAAKGLHGCSTDGSLSYLLMRIQLNVLVAIAKQASLILQASHNRA